MGGLSCYFQVGELILWNPSNVVAKAFCLQAEAFAKLRQRPNGLGQIVDDECEVNPLVFKSFIGDLIELYQDSNHKILKSLLKGFLATSTVLLMRSEEDLSPEMRDWEAIGEEQARWMPVG